jgi:putative ABC transport system substrate-binding protein
MRRREFIAGIGITTAWPLTARGQKSGILPSVGIVWIASQAEVAPFQQAFLQGLRDLGYVVGETITIEARFAEGKVELAPGLVEDLVRRKVDVIVAPSAGAVRLIKKATTTIPIVMANVSDPVGFEFVASLQRPGGIVTGFSNLMVEQVGKNVELCREAISKLSRLAVLINPAVPDATLVLREVQAAAQALGFAVHPLEARQPEDLEGAIARAGEQRVDARLVSTIEGMIFANRVLVIEAAAKHRLPAVFAAPPFGLASAGALLAYGASTPDMLRHAASYVDKIIKGAKPADLPVQQPTKFELGVNLKTAKALGLTIPPSILVRADEVIE